MSNRVKIIGLLVLAAGLIAAIVYATYHKPHTDMHITRADLETTVEKLHMLYEMDEGSANKKFLGKVIDLKGTVEKTAYGDGVWQIYFISNNPLSQVTASMDHLSDHPGIETVTPGDEVQLRCTCSGMLMDVTLDRCVILK